MLQPTARGRSGSVDCGVFEPARALPRDRGTDRARSSKRRRIEDDLREYSIGELEGTPFNTLHSEHNFFERMHDLDFNPRGGESVKRRRGTHRRCAATYRGPSATPTHVVVVGHGAALGVALASLLDGDPTRWTNYAFSNGSITELTFAPTPHVPSFNRTDHL